MTTIFSIPLAVSALALGGTLGGVAALWQTYGVAVFQAYVLAGVLPCF